MTTREDRERAARFYYSKSGLTGGVCDWIDSGVVVADYPIDEDVRDLVGSFAGWREAAVAAERERIAKMADTLAALMDRDGADTLRAFATEIRSGT